MFLKFQNDEGKMSFIFYLIIVFLIIFAIALSVYLSIPGEFDRNKDIAIANCINLCRQKIGTGVIIADGPCLSNNISVGWACDVVHDPKITIVDNLPENQCHGDFKNFVEVNLECQFVGVG